MAGTAAERAAATRAETTRLALLVSGMGRELIHRGGAPRWAGSQRVYLFQAEEIRGEGVEVGVRDLVRAVGRHHRLPRRLRLLGHLLGGAQPGLDLVRLELAPHAVERALGVAHAADGVARLALRHRRVVDLLPLLHVLGRRRRRETDDEAERYETLHAPPPRATGNGRDSISLLTQPE